MSTENISIDDALEALILEEKTTINQRTIRFSDATWYIPNTPVIIGGAGGIGSKATF